MTSLKARKLFMKGLKAFRREDFEKALNFFQKVQSLELDVPAVHHNIATAYMKLRDFRRAEKHLLEALNLDSKYTFAFFKILDFKSILRLTRRPLYCPLCPRCTLF